MSNLVMDIRIPWTSYVGLLDAMGTAGILEPGYVSASKDRGYTSIRLPGITKEDSENKEDK